MAVHERIDCDVIWREDGLDSGLLRIEDMLGRDMKEHDVVGRDGLTELGFVDVSGAGAETLKECCTL